MDFDAFQAVAMEALRQRPYDNWMIDDYGTAPADNAATQDELDRLTAKLIEYEQVAALIPEERDRLDDLSSKLNYLYDPEYAAGDEIPGRERSNQSPAAIRSWYEMAVANLAEVRASLNGHAQIVQALVSAYTAARAKVEHDLGWQAYVREQFGVDPSTIERENKRAGSIIEHAEAIACAA